MTKTTKSPPARLLTGTVFSLLRVMGALPLAEDGAVTPALLAWTILTNTVLLSLACYTVYSGNVLKSGPESQDQEVRAVASTIQFSVNSCVATVSVAAVALNRRHLIGAYRRLPDLAPRRGPVWTTLFFVPFIFFAMTYDLLQYKIYSKGEGRLINYFVYYIDLLLIMCVETLFTFSLRQVLASYEAASSILGGIKSQYHLRDLLLKVREADKACELINKTFSVPLLIIFTAFFGSIISQIYYFLAAILSYLDDSLGDDPLQSLVYLWITLCVAFEIWKVTWTSTSTKNKMNKFNKTLYGLCLQDKSSELPKNEWVKIHLQKRIDVNITACHFFNIELSILQSMLGAATTYIVIMLQYQFSHEK